MRLYAIGQEARFTTILEQIVVTKERVPVSDVHKNKMPAKISHGN